MSHTGCDSLLRTILAYEFRNAAVPLHLPRRVVQILVQSVYRRRKQRIVPILSPNSAAYFRIRNAVRFSPKLLKQLPVSAQGLCAMCLSNEKNYLVLGHQGLQCPSAEHHCHQEK